MDNKKLTKSSIDRRWAGVCGGLAEYFDVDSTLVRLLFVVFTLTGGPGLLVYLVLMIALPSDNRVFDEYEFEKAKRKNDFAA